MGYMRHHAIIVTGSHGNYLSRARKKAVSLFPYVSPISKVSINGYQSFFIPPDGSKEGWDESDLGDNARQKFKTWLRALCHEDYSSPLQWVEVQYGDENGETLITADSDEPWRKNNPNATNL